jgi:tRNA-dihydrouridine synthase A
MKSHMSSTFVLQRAFSRVAFSPFTAPVLAAARRRVFARSTMTIGENPKSSRMASPPPQLLSVAPMMDWTDLHYRQLARLLSKNVWLYTEMVVDSTIIHNPDHDRFLWFPPEQHPISCQLGGSDPAKLAHAAAIVATYGYDEINLNCGCPSDRVAGAGCFGASLMLRPETVAECCAAVSGAVNGTPVTVKCRIGVDDVDSYEAFHRFIETVSEKSSVKHFIIHARKCMLNGLSPLQNRTIPPLRYQWVWALKRDFPELEFSLNGGILTLEETVAALRMPSDIAPEGMTGVMIGRAAYNDPWNVLANADVAIWGANSNQFNSRREVLEAYAKYADDMIGRWNVKEDGHRYPSVRILTKPLLSMFHNAPRGKKWRAAVDCVLKTATSVSEVLDKTLDVLIPEVLDAPPTELNAVEGTVEACRELLKHYEAEEIPATPHRKKGELPSNEENEKELASI